jgi:hypothetical protein
MDETASMATKESAAMAGLRRFRDGARRVAVSPSFSSAARGEIVVRGDH